MRATMQKHDFSKVKYFGTLYEGIGVWHVDKVKGNKIFATKICVNADDSEWEGTFDAKSGQMIDGDCDKSFYLDYKIAWVPNKKQQEQLDTLQCDYCKNLRVPLEYMLQCIQKSKKRKK